MTKDSYQYSLLSPHDIYFLIMLVRSFLINFIELGDANSVQFTRAYSDICISKLFGLFIKLRNVQMHKKKWEVHMNFQEFT